ncbi:site-2 protease family protein [Streptomyces sp. NPDC050264]|uniref:site-2 protease family protein n=1 Tax=Streptomyces sp. NPDC050264 TaxID=3155038 RepID=UPI0034161AD0
MDESGQPQSGTGEATPPTQDTGRRPAHPHPTAPPTPADPTNEAPGAPRTPSAEPYDAAPAAGDTSPQQPAADPAHEDSSAGRGPSSGPDDAAPVSADASPQQPVADSAREGFGAGRGPSSGPSGPGGSAPVSADASPQQPVADSAREGFGAGQGPSAEASGPGDSAAKNPSAGQSPSAEPPGPGDSTPANAAAQSGPGDSTEVKAAPSPDPRDATPAHPYDTHPDRSAATSGRRQRKGPAKRPEPRGGILMGRPFGVPVYVAPSWFLVAALITWVFGGQLDRVLPELGAARYLVSLFFAVAFYASVLVHELAHVVAALRFKLPVRRIMLQFFGGVSEIEKESETPGREFVLAFVGPLLSLVLSGVFYLGMMAVEPGTVPGVLLAGLMVSNLIVAAFNLLPGLPLDGGRMLRAVVWKITGKPMSGTVAAAWVGRALAVTVLIGLPLLTQSGALGQNAEDVSGMDTVTDALLAAILAAIIWTGAGNSLRMARLREHLPELRARTLTRRAVPVEAATPLSEALRRANESGARALVVVDVDGEPRSLVREAAIVGVPEHRRPWVAVSGLAQDLTDGMRVSAELAGEDLLDTLRAAPATEYLVVENNGAIYGVLSAADVERAFVKAMARPS